MKELNSFIDKNYKSDIRVIIDGVLCVPNGEFLDEFDEDNGCLIKTLPDWDYFDIETGNKFCTNCTSKEQAEEVIQRLKKEDIDAVIGPKGPWIGDNGEPIPNKCLNGVGVYFVGEIVSDVYN
jgi:hypothetical protein